MIQKEIIDLYVLGTYSVDKYRKAAIEGFKKLRVHTQEVKLKKQEEVKPKEVATTHDENAAALDPPTDKKDPKP